MESKLLKMADMYTKDYIVNISTSITYKLLRKNKQQQSVPPTCYRYGGINYDVLVK